MSPAPFDRPTIGERYTGATESKNLRVTEHRGDADMLIAAGWLEDSLGALLFRLKAEFDSAHGDMERSDDYADTLRAAIADLRKEEKRERRLMKYGPTFAMRYELQAGAIEVQLTTSLLTGKVMALIKLKTLHEAKQVLFRYADKLATTRRYMVSSKELAPLIGLVLDVYLDPLCHQCDGRGFTGGSHKGEKTTICRDCRGTGHRKDAVGKDPRSHWFAGLLLAEMERILAVAAGGMRDSLRVVNP